MLLKINNKLAFFYNTFYHYIANNYISESHESSTFESFKAYFYSSNNLFTKKLRKQGMALSAQFIVVLEFLLIYAFIYFSISELYNLYVIYLFNNYCTISILSLYIFNAYYFNKFIDDDKIKSKFITYLIARSIFLIIINFVCNINLILSISITILFIIVMIYFNKHAVIFIFNIRSILFGKFMPKYKLTKLKYWSALMSIFVFLVYFDFITFKNTIELANFSTILLIFKELSQFNINLKNIIFCSPEDTISTKSVVKWSVYNPAITNWCYQSYTQAVLSTNKLPYQTLGFIPTSGIYSDKSIEGFLLRTYTNSDINVYYTSWLKYKSLMLKNIDILNQKLPVHINYLKEQPFVPLTYDNRSKILVINYCKFTFPGTSDNLLAFFRSMYGLDATQYIKIESIDLNKGVTFTIRNEKYENLFKQALFNHKKIALNNFLLLKIDKNLATFNETWISGYPLKSNELIVLKSQQPYIFPFAYNTKEYIKFISGSVQGFASKAIVNYLNLPNRGTSRAVMGAVMALRNNKPAVGIFLIANTVYKTIELKHSYYIQHPEILKNHNYIGEHYVVLRSGKI